MDSATISALAAPAGAVVGGVTSFGTSWLNQQTQAKVRPGRTSKNPWRRWIDTGLDFPQDIAEWDKTESVPSDTYRAEPRSVVLLFGYLI